MSRLFRRVWRVQVGTLATEDLDVAFKVKRTLAATPGTCELTIYNLNADHRRELRPNAAGRLRVFCQVDAGFEGTRSMLFRGDTRRIEHKRDGTEWVTVITAGDGEHAIRRARVVAAFAPDTTVASVVRALAQTMGVGEGNLASVVGRFGASSRAGTVLHGQAAQELTRICTAAGLEWSVQDGALQLLVRGQALQREAVVLSPETGLLGSPERCGWRKIKLSALLQPDLVPGRRVVVQSSTATGEYRIVEAEYAGETRGEDWNVDLVCRDIALDAPLIV